MTLHLGPIDILRGFSSLSRNASGNALSGLIRDLAPAAAAALREQLLSLHGTVPVRWTRDPRIDGWYRVSDVESDLLLSTATSALLTWSASATLVGRPGKVDLASQLTGNGRQRDAGWPAPERWVAPPRGHRAFYAGAGLNPAKVTRNGQGGPLAVYRQFPDIDPRWAVDLDDYYAGAVTLRHAGGLIVGDASFDDPTGWELGNELIRVAPAGNGRLVVSGWNGDAWVDKAFEVRFGATVIATWHGLTVLRNDPEEIAIRLLRDHDPGRLTCDLTLRRGARHVAVYLQRHTAADLTVAREAPEAATTGTGRIHATGLTTGMRWVLGSARAATQDLVNGSLKKAATRTFDVMIGMTPDAQSGDAPADLLAQYIGSPAERVEAVPR